MRRKLMTFLCVLAVLSLTVSTVQAGGNVRLSGVNFALGSLIAKGLASGLDQSDVKLVLEAVGSAVVTCKNGNGNQMPGGSPVVIGTGHTLLLASDPFRHNGESLFRVETNNPGVSGPKSGCPAGWTAQVDFVFWKKASITAYDVHTLENLGQQFYACTTTRTGPQVHNGSVTCTPL